ncbi:21891_t:CDS:2 [Cetraspora pellucida]|uniref:21891_t:CDS:1 n=1 Tax=Cetraspora pellucida TaxID=1433469 RepID=A0A9N9JWG6_9GLOM|nr:21891_t:CDS:2 [Cetraspora pellucida]
MTFVKKLINKLNKKTNIEDKIEQDNSWSNYIEKNKNSWNVEENENSWKFEENENSWKFEENENSWDEKNNESSWSTNEKEILETSFTLIEQENPFDNTLIIKETNIKICQLEIQFLLIKLQLAEEDIIKYIDPFQICYSQRQINNTFQIGNDIENTINDLVNNKIKIENFPIIQICIIDDIFYSSDNRRLYCFKEAIRRGLNIKKIPVNIKRISDLNINWKMKGNYKIVKHNDYRNIIVSPFAKNGRVIDKKGYWEYRE